MIEAVKRQVLGPEAVEVQSEQVNQRGARVAEQTYSTLVRQRGVQRDTCVPALRRQAGERYPKND